MDYFIIILIAYLLGSVNFSIVISKYIYNDDIRQYGSKNAGSTNALRVRGKKFGLMVLTGDMTKGVIAVLVGGYLCGNLGKLIAGFFVILGHVYPVFFKFKGGKGVATTTAVVLAFDIRVFAIFLTVFTIVLIISKFVSLGSICASFSIPFSMFFLYNDWIYVSFGLLITLFIIYLHRANIARILNKEESKVSFKKK